ncbi:Signal peptidase I [Tenacibaculum sp. 190130A14a]|uniref:Signal peptidase I n=1 Tax=Tenacibaculum polynesiense TaxID=3137857 RepID=A0ABM9PFD3_9FLAO
MNRNLKRVLIALAILFGVYQILGVTGILKLYHNPTMANEPNIPFKSFMFVSNLIKPENKDFVCYNFNDDLIGKHVRVHRLLGKEGDIIEIRKGVFYINNINIDESLVLMHMYEFSYEKGKEIEEVIDNPYTTFNIETKKLKTPLIDQYVEEKKIEGKRLLKLKNEMEEDIQKVYNHKWNKDNFGPLKIPEGKVFLVGDNRDFSLDSRYIGLIDDTEILGVVLYR